MWLWVKQWKIKLGQTEKGHFGVQALMFLKLNRTWSNTQVIWFLCGYTLNLQSSQTAGIPPARRFSSILPTSNSQHFESKIFIYPKHRLWVLHWCVEWSKSKDLEEEETSPCKDSLTVHFVVLTCTLCWVLECSLGRPCPWCWYTGSRCGRWATEFQVGSSGRGCGRRRYVARCHPPGKNSGPECRSPLCFSPERENKKIFSVAKKKTQKTAQGAKHLTFLKDFYPRRQLCCDTLNTRDFKIDILTLPLFWRELVN